MSNDIITVESHNGFMHVDTLENAIRCSELIAGSSFCPKSLMGKPGDVLVALQMGQELGLKPMQALQNVAVINGRPSIWGDAMLAICRQSKDFEYIREDYDEAKDAFVCTVKRRNEPEFVRSFSMAEAKTAGLVGKEGPWRAYPKRMLQMRARGFALRDAFPDTLRGIIIAEEAQDMPVTRVDYSDLPGTTIEMTDVASNVPLVESAPALVSELQVVDLVRKIKESDSDMIKMCELLKIGSIEEMNVIQYDQVSKMLAKKLAQKKTVESVAANEFFKDEEES